MPIPPILIEWLIKLLLAGALLGFTYYEGHKHGALAAEQQLKDYEATVLQATIHQQAVAQQTEAQQAQITQEVGNDYQTKLATLRTGYEWLSAHPPTVTRIVSTFPTPTHSPDGGTSNNVPTQPAPVETVIPYDALKLAEDCAVTTQQLVGLQAWLEQVSRL